MPSLGHEMGMKRSRRSRALSLEVGEGFEAEYIERVTKLNNQGRRAE